MLSHINIAVRENQTQAREFLCFRKKDQNQIQLWSMWLILTTSKTNGVSGAGAFQNLHLPMVTSSGTPNVSTEGDRELLESMGEPALSLAGGTV